MTYTREQREAKQALLDQRESREQETRIAEEIHESYPDWDSDLLLDTSRIPARPGYVQRWVRTGVKGEIDRGNVFKKMNKGWKPRLLSTVPKAQRILRMDFEGDEVIGIHGMVLMEMPEELFNRIAARNKSASELQMAAVKNDLFKLRDSGFSRPEFQNETKVQMGRPAPIDD
jgi:RNase P/RNase MRP subunit p29